MQEIRSYRASIPSRGIQAQAVASTPRVFVDFFVGMPSAARLASLPKAVSYYSPEQEIMYGPACWLWDYLRRSGLSGFFLPLSGDDSPGFAILLYFMDSFGLNAKTLSRG